jgi:hypothetical protein
VAPLAQIVNDDIRVALNEGPVPLGGWGGSFYYYDMPYKPERWKEIPGLTIAPNEQFPRKPDGDFHTVGDEINRVGERELLLGTSALTVKQMVVAGEIRLSDAPQMLETNWNAQMPAMMKAEVMGRATVMVAEHVRDEVDQNLRQLPEDAKRWLDQQREQLKDRALDRLDDLLQPPSLPSIPRVSATERMPGASEWQQLAGQLDQALARQQTQAQQAAASTLPPDFAPSRQGLRDIRDPSHEGHDALREMQWRAALFETQNNIPQGPHTERLGASMLAFAVDNRMHYQDVRLERNQDTGQVQLTHARYGDPKQHFSADLRQMSSQPIEETSHRIDTAVSRHNADAGPVLPRTREQAQALEGYSFDDRVTFARIRGGIPGHISDDHIGWMVLEAKKQGIDASNLAQVSMVGDQIRLQRSGPDEKTVLVDVNAPAPSLQASIEATNTFNRQQALVQQHALALQQDAPTQDGPALKGPTR